ncbi:MAG TPA: sigma-70 family RNA polymerase sigma factor [Pirellulaceae bacterium]|nr:sigma-70 family RNA polymerase sigma factor [Pirellulaceae bacterium]HMO93381.1 sigma-70 family RNA polymerase sigma factor [Pirellulaceae bacterium]HMP70441.1 sigma-70 family RNA polymerase sigma factor [Pirellulaceae bacterium]
MTRDMVDAMPNEIVTNNRNPATEAAYYQYAPELRFWLMRRLRDSNQVDDVLQMAFLKLSQQIDSINPDSVRAWLFRVATNEVHLNGRKQQIELRAWRLLRQDSELTSQPAESIALNHELIALTAAAIDSLPENQRIIVRLKFFEGMTFAQIAEHLKAPLGTVLSRMRLATKKLERIFERNGS